MHTATRSFQRAGTPPPPPPIPLNNCVRVSNYLSSDSKSCILEHVSIDYLGSSALRSFLETNTYTCTYTHTCCIRQKQKKAKAVKKQTKTNAYFFKVYIKTKTSYQTQNRTYMPFYRSYNAILEKGKPTTTNSPVGVPLYVQNRASSSRKLIVGRADKTKIQQKRQRRVHPPPPMHHVMNTDDLPLFHVGKTSTSELNTPKGRYYPML